jgi:hypothetical protein
MPLETREFKGRGEKDEAPDPCEGRPRLLRSHLWVAITDDMEYRGNKDLVQMNTFHCSISGNYVTLSMRF